MEHSIDRETVINGLQNLRDAIATDFIHEADQAVGTIDDAIALLKEQDNCENCAIAIEDRQTVVRREDCNAKTTVGTALQMRWTGGLRWTGRR